MIDLSTLSAILQTEPPIWLAQINRHSNGGFFVPVFCVRNPQRNEKLDKISCQSLSKTPMVAKWVHVLTVFQKRKVSF